MKLPGVGRYSAGAVLSIAYEKSLPLVDGNVIRVFSRIFNLRGKPEIRRRPPKGLETGARLGPRQTPRRLQPSLDGIRRDGLFIGQSALSFVSYDFSLRSGEKRSAERIA